MEKTPRDSGLTTSDMILDNNNCNPGACLITGMDCIDVGAASLMLTRHLRPASEYHLGRRVTL